MASEHRNFTIKETVFIANYLVTLNASASYRATGYAGRNANNLGSQMLAKPHIKDAIQKAMLARVERTGISGEMVIQELAKLGFSSIRKFVSINDDGQAKVNLNNANEDDLDSLSLVESKICLRCTGTDEGGNKTYDIIQTTRIKLHNKLIALGKLAQHTGAYKHGKQAVSSDMHDTVAEIQRRMSRAAG